MFSDKDEQAARKYLHSLLSAEAIYDAKEAESYVFMTSGNIAEFMMNEYNWPEIVAWKFKPEAAEGLWNTDYRSFVFLTVFNVFCDDLLDLNEELEVWEEMHKDAPTQSDLDDEHNRDFDLRR